MSGGYDILVKPVFDNGGGGLVVDKPGTYNVYGPDGTLIESVRASGPQGEHGIKAQSRAIASGLPAGSYIEFEGTKYQLTEGGARHEFVYGNSKPTLVSGKGAIGSMPGGGGGGMFPNAGGVAGGVAFPYNLASQFPNPVTINYQPIVAAPFKYTDPMKFAKKFAEFNRGEFQKNVVQSKEFALDALDTELKGLQFYTPKAAALKRYETAADNVFNQQERTKQLQAAIPDVLADQDQQAEDARAYAEGRLPDQVVDNALSLTTRSEAADIATSGGFGQRSSASRKMSDLMSARERFQISQYGNQLKSASIADRANLRLAPTSYSDAGQQIRVMPSVSGSQLQQAYGSELNRATILDPGTGLSTEVNQQQFQTNLEQDTRKFNTSNQLDTDKYNATTQNDFALQKFGYQAQFANAYQQATQGALNLEREDTLREQNMAVFEDYLKKAQKAGDKKAIASGLSQLFQAFGGFSGFIDTIKDVFGSDTDTVEQGDALDIDPEDPNVNSVDDIDTDFSTPDFSLDPNVGSGNSPDGPEVDLSDPNYEVPDFSLDYTGGNDNPYDSSDLNSFYSDMGY